MTIGERIKRMRLDRGMTQHDLALAIDGPDRVVNMRRQISAWESGRGPSLDSLRRIADAFDVSMDEMMEGVE